jgi:hypothetical protein
MDRFLFRSAPRNSPVSAPWRVADDVAVVEGRAKRGGAESWAGSHPGNLRARQEINAQFGG